MKKGCFVFLLAIFLSIPVCHADLPITSNFGWRVHPISGNMKFHAGVDLGYDYGTPINCLFDGQVVQVGDCEDGYGNQVLMYHPAMDAYTRYAHMSAVNVEMGAYYFSGTIIGYVGSTGNSTRPHLHLEYIVPDGNGGYEYTDPLLLWQ